MIRFMTTAAAATLALAVSAVAGSAQEATTFDVNRDDQGRAAFEDFNAGFDQMGTYDAWDADKDGMLSREEFNHGVWAYYDMNDDDFLDDTEMSTMGNDTLFLGATTTAGGAATENQD